MSAAEPIGVSESNSESSINTLITDNIDIWTGAVKRRSASGRGSSKKIVLTGVKKLRELILELAVRGRLVPQDSTDEPASVLLEKIAAEKAQLVKDKKIKKQQKALPVISEDEKPFGLPDGWEWVRLGSLFNLIVDCPHSTAKFQDKGNLCLDTNSFKQGRLLDHKFRYVSQQTFDDRNKRLVPQPKDIVFAREGSVGESVVIPEGINCCLGQRVMLFRPSSILNSEFLRITISSPNTLKALLLIHKGIGAKHVNVSDMKSYAVCVPPRAEQHRIVAKVDELMLLCDALERETEVSLAAHQTLVESLLATLTNTHTSTASNISESEPWALIEQNFDVLFTTEQSIDSLKQTILQLAVMGKLVPQNPDDQPAANLLEKIAIEKAQLIKDKKIKKQKVLPAITEDEKPFGLPVGWAWVRLGELGYDMGGGTPSKSKSEYWNGDIPWVSPKDMKVDFITAAIDSITEQAIKETTVKFIPEGSLLMVVRGMILAHSFPAAITTVPVAINQDMKALVFSYIENNFMLLMVKGLKNEFIDLVDRSSHGTCKLVSEKLWPKVCAIPPVDEQHRIVTKVDQLMTLCDQLKAQLGEAQTSQCQLADAVVSQAVN